MICGSPEHGSIPHYVVASAIFMALAMLTRWKWWIFQSEFTDDKTAYYATTIDKNTVGDF